MSIYRKLEEQAKKFEAVYPSELAARLAWWRKSLGIDRVRLLRLIGMSARQAAAREAEDLKEILKSAEWAEKAQLLEGRLHRLLSLFHYDWHALAERLHKPAAPTDGGEPSRVVRRKGEVERLGYVPNGDSSARRHNRLAEGGPQSLSAFLADLAESAVDSDRAES